MVHALLVPNSEHMSLSVCRHHWPTFEQSVQDLHLNLQSNGKLQCVDEYVSFF